MPHERESAGSWLSRQPLPGRQVAIAAAEGATAGIAIDQELLFSDLPTPAAHSPES